MTCWQPRCTHSCVEGFPCFFFKLVLLISNASRVDIQCGWSRNRSIIIIYTVTIYCPCWHVIDQVSVTYEGKLGFDCLPVQLDRVPSISAVSGCFSVELANPLFDFSKSMIWPRCPSLPRHQNFPQNQRHKSPFDHTIKPIDYFSISIRQ